MDNHYDKTEKENNDIEDESEVVLQSVATVPITPVATTTTTTTTPTTTPFLSPPPVCGLVGVDTPLDLYLSRKHVMLSSDVESPISTKEEKEEANKAKRNPTLVIDKNNIPDINIILPLRALITMIQSQFMCRTSKCRKAAGKMLFELETYGVASSLHVRCSCSRANSASATLTAAAELKMGNRRNGAGYRNKVSSLSFDLNYKILMALQLNGGGRQELKNVAGMLNIANNPMSQKITKLRNKIGLAIIKVAKEVMAENLELEKSVSPTDENEKKLLSVSNDARWDKRSSGRTYNSTSGCSVMMGCRTKLVLGLECMSTRCISCQKKEFHELELCSKNYIGSAKGMESTGALALVKRLTTEETGCFIKDYVSDDDSTCRAILTHSFRELIKAGRMKKADVPRGNCKEKGPGMGALKWNSGRLPLRHPGINKLADKGHRLRGHCVPLFSWSRGSRENSRGGTTDLDCLRYKRRGGWTLRLYGGEPYEEFKRHVKAFLEHHFDNHEFCGDWCKAKGKEGEEKEEHSLRFRCKEKNKEMYVAFKDLHDAFMDDEKLRQLHHVWDTNAVEGFNKLITKFLPKDRNLATTIENKARTHLAVCLLSIGYKQTFKRLFNILGLSREGYCEQFIRSEDRTRQWRKYYRKKPEVMKARMENLYKKIREGNERYRKDKKRGLDYSSGMMGMNSVKEDGPLSTKKSRKTPSGCCKHCGLDTHRRISSGLCRMNPKNAMVTVENGGGIEDLGEIDGLKESIVEDENLVFELGELQKLDALESRPLDPIIEEKSDHDDSS